MALEHTGRWKTNDLSSYQIGYNGWTFRRENAKSSHLHHSLSSSSREPRRPSLTQVSAEKLSPSAIWRHYSKMKVGDLQQILPGKENRGSKDLTPSLRDQPVTYPGVRWWFGDPTLSSWRFASSHRWCQWGCAGPSLCVTGVTQELLESYVWLKGHNTLLYLHTIVIAAVITCIPVLLYFIKP